MHPDLLKDRTCPACDGRGWFWDHEFLFGLIPIPSLPVTCPCCNGTGRIPDHEEYQL